MMYVLFFLLLPCANFEGKYVLDDGCMTGTCFSGGGSHRHAIKTDDSVECWVDSYQNWILEMQSSNFKNWSGGQ